MAFLCSAVELTALLAAMPENKDIYEYKNSISLPPLLYAPLLAVHGGPKIFTGKFQQNNNAISGFTV